MAEQNWLQRLGGWFTGSTNKKKAADQYGADLDASSANAQAELNNQFGQVKKQTDDYNQGLFKGMQENQQKALGEAQRNVLGSAGARGLAGGAGASVRALGTSADQSQKELNTQMSNIQGDANQRLANMLFGSQQALSAEQREAKRQKAKQDYDQKMAQTSPMENVAMVAKEAAQIAKMFV